MRIFYLTRTYPSENLGGGGIIRKGTIDHLKKNGYEVWVISPNYNGAGVDVNDDHKHILLPHVGNFKLCSFLETIGLWEDYMAGWVYYAVRYLRKILKKEDLLFATSGGELGTIILAKKLADIIGCKYVINLHDPISFTTVNGEVTRYIKTKFRHVTRDKTEYKYLFSASAIITSSESYRDCLMQKYPVFAPKISCHHFGYIKSLQYSKRKPKGRINIVYGGAMGELQSPEILAEAVGGIENVKVVFIGNWRSNPKLIQYEKCSNIDLIDVLPNREYIKYLQDNADVGFVSLKGQLAEICIPSKLYEFINLGLPILGILGGDGRNIIRNNLYGVVVRYSVQSLREAILDISNPKKLSMYKNNVIRDREKWAMDCQIKDVLSVINEI